ncbi:MAG: hypothetical protein AB8C13_06780 [Phycisphaerales bacterium]
MKRKVCGMVFGAAMSAGVLSLVLGAGGCVSYTNVPEPSSAPAFKNANTGSSIKVISAGLRRMVNTHPMRDSQGRYVVNLPAGTTPETANRIVQLLPEGGVIPYQGMGAMPTYHISRVWLRGARGKVDVVYPIRTAEGMIDGGVTLWMQGGDQPWNVERMQYWAPGTVPTPPVYIPVDGYGRDAGVQDVQFAPPLEGETQTEISDERIDLIEYGTDEPVMREPVVDDAPFDGVLYREIKD